ncbi:MAG: bifunctional glucose-1-phosphatase/inositol phosphatase [Cardiobacteriaceae bacterium]|nr:bifunctional glucose-1-phosphatase/inositol phosphatase [Cardiobacteriaceae bacterium]
MKKIKLLIALTLASATTQATESSEQAFAPKDYHLEKVVMFSRHGIRAPLVGYGSALAEATPQTWPTWQTEGGHLTPKGTQLEALFAVYLGEWLEATGLIKKDQCQTDQFLIYTNSLPRTIATGQAFADKAFPDCGLKVRHQEEVGKMDDTFNPIVRREVTPEFEQQLRQSIDESLGGKGFAGLNERLADNYAELEKVLDYGQSVACQEKKSCDFRLLENTLSFEQGKEPKTTGALRNGTGAGDNFILQYYEGFPENEVAWGKITSEDSWKKITAIKDLYNDVLFGSPLMAKEAATPLLLFIQNAFHDAGYQHDLIVPARQAKVVLLVGHDSNVGSLLPLLKVKPYQLPKQYEHTPSGGKLVFQKWRDGQGKAWAKVEYVYQSTEQLRIAEALDLKNPPQKVVLELSDCPINEQGFCPFEQFEQAMKKALE